MDAKPRELYLLFRAYDGYENSQLKVTSKNGKTTSVISETKFLFCCSSGLLALTLQCHALFLLSPSTRDVASEEFGRVDEPRVHTSQ